jgi:hypothetical protein
MRSAIGGFRSPTARARFRAWAVQRGAAVLTTSTNPGRIRENFAISPLPEDALQQMRDDIATRVRFNAVVETGVPGFVPRPREPSTSPDGQTPSRPPAA